jgi:hypothetical protein
MAITNLSLKFLRGLQESLPTTGTDGYFYLTTDTHRLYTSIDSKLVPVNEGVTTVANVAALSSVAGAHAGDFFYCTEENILAVYNGKTFVQINPDTGVTSVEVVGEGNAVTAASYDATTRKLTLTMGETFATKAYVGEIPETSTATNIVAYVQEKTAGIATDTALAELTGRVATAEQNITAINNAETGILAQAKNYVDEKNKFVTDILTVDKFGGIAAGSDLNGMTTHEILNQLLYPYIAFTINSSSRNAAAAILENGASQTLNSATINVTKKSKPITSIKLLNGSTVLEEKTGDAVAAGGTITFSNLGITVTKDNNPNLKFTVTDGTTSTDKNVGASTFVYPYYMGECAADATIDETLIEGLTKKVESKGAKTVTHSCENGRMVIAYPKAHGVLKSILDPNNFETIGDYTRSEVSVTGLDGTAQTYYVYASGAATVSGFKVQYKY